MPIPSADPHSILAPAPHVPAVPSIRSGKPVLTRTLCGLLCGMGLASSGFAVEMDTAEMTSVSEGGGNFDYTITLENNGTENTGTFWYSWVPGQGYLPALPTNIVSPTGWAAIITDGPVPSNGYSIQWVASSNLLKPTSALTFSFEIAATPAALAGNSTIHQGIPVGTSTVYSGTPLAAPATSS